MEIVELPLERLQGARWNPNVMGAPGLARLQESISRYGWVVPLVVRPQTDGDYEVLSGNQRLTIARKLGLESVSSVVVDLDDAHARLLAQALNHLHGEDDLGLRAELMRTVLRHLPPADVLAVLPESADSLKELAALGQQDMAEYVRDWQRAQGARLHHFTARLTGDQLAVVRETLEPFLAQVTSGDDGNPNRPGLALLRLCEAYRELREGSA